MTTSESSSALSRRTVARGAAWTVPAVVIAAAAPRAAASPCLPASYTINFGGTDPFTRAADGRSATIRSNDPAGNNPPVLLQISTAYTSNTRPGSESGANANLTIQTGAIGGTLNGGLTLSQTIFGTINPPQRNQRGTYTFVFTVGGAPVEVTDLRFTVTDIDSTSGDFIDRVELSGLRTAVTPATVTGNGTAASPWTNTNTNRNLPNSSSAGNVAVVYTAPTSSFDLVYWNAVTSFSGADRSQGIFISDMTFTYAADNC